MQNTTRIALFLLVAASAMAGFDGGCGSIEPQPLPPAPNPTEPPPECVDLLVEAACVADASCRAIYVEAACVCPGCVPGAECPPCECPRNFVGCQDRSGCDGLDEVACNADPACEPIFAVPACLSTPEQDPCFEPGCGCGGTPTYAGCHDRVACPPILCQPCEFGAVVDSNGCATCECLPPPDPCAGLPEDACIAAPGCDPTYASDGGAGRSAPCDCEGAGCNCGEDPPVDPYTGCVSAPVSCENLGEQQCAMTPGCHPEYAYPPCTGFCPPDDPACGGDDSGRPACPPVFTQCVPDVVQPECFSDFDCRNGYCDYGAGSGLAPPGPGGDEPRPDVPTPAGGLCVYPSCGDGGPISCDAIAPDCGVGQVAGALNGCWGCFDARTCAPVMRPSECWSDNDCPSGYCDGGNGGGSSGGGSGGEPPPGMDPGEGRPVPAPSGMCVYPICGDGAPVLCDAIPPSCGVGQVSGAWNGCWACFDARTCLPVEPPVGCTSDAECPNGYCDQGANSSGGSDDRAFPVPPPPPGGQCVFVSCDDGSPLMCRRQVPICDPGTVVAIINGCYQCLDARTCLPPCDPTTTDCG